MRHNVASTNTYLFCFVFCVLPKLERQSNDRRSCTEYSKVVCWTMNRCIERRVDWSRARNSLATLLSDLRFSYVLLVKKNECFDKFIAYVPTTVVRDAEHRRAPKRQCSNLKFELLLWMNEMNFDFTVCMNRFAMSWGCCVSAGDIDAWHDLTSLNVCKKQQVNQNNNNSNDI